MRVGFFFGGGFFRDKKQEIRISEVERRISKTITIQKLRN